MNKTKITVKVYAPLLAAFDEQLDRLFIKRDAFLNHMIRTEISHLENELEGRELSGKARRYISGQLKRMGTRTINVVVDKETAELLTAVVDRSNIVRDAFLNRLIMFLRSSNSLLTHLELPRVIVRSEFNSYYEEMPTSPLEAMESVLADPLYYLRIAAEERVKGGLYLLDLPQKLSGFTCFLEDAEVPGSREYDEKQKQSMELLDELLRFEIDAFSNVSATSVAMEDQQ